MSTPYKLELYTKTNIHIANLCVVMEKTPILDQILALAMFVKSGNEESILAEANYNNLTKDIEIRKSLALANPYLEKKLKVNEIVNIPIRSNNIPDNLMECTPDKYELMRNIPFIPPSNNTCGIINTQTY